MDHGDNIRKSKILGDICTGYVGSIHQHHAQYIFQSSLVRQSLSVVPSPHCSPFFIFQLIIHLKLVIKIVIMYCSRVMGHIGQGPAVLGRLLHGTEYTRTQNSRRSHQGHIGQERIVMSATIVHCSDFILLCSNLSKTYQIHPWFQNIGITSNKENNKQYMRSVHFYFLTFLGNTNKVNGDSQTQQRKDLVIYQNSRLSTL